MAEDVKPWETEKAPALTPEESKELAAATSNPDPDIEVTEEMPAVAQASVDTVEEDSGATVKVTKLPNGVVKRVVVTGQQADLRVVNAVSQGMSVKDAKAKFGIK